MKGWSQTKIAEEVGTSQSDVSRKNEVAQTSPPKLQERLKKGEITSSKGAKLSTLPKDIQKEFEDKVSRSPLKTYENASDSIISLKKLKMSSTRLCLQPRQKKKRKKKQKK